MTIDRRSFLYAGGLTAAAAPLATAAHAAVQGARSITEFGVEPNADRDQTAALQKAIDELSRAGEPVTLPGGRYMTGTLKLPRACAILGVPHATVLKTAGAGPIFTGAQLTGLHISGLTFEPDLTSKSGSSAIELSGATVNIAHCRFTGRAAACIALQNCSGRIEAVDIEDALVTGIRATEASGLIISRCRISRCQGAGILVSGSAGQIEGFVASQNQIAGCGVAIVADGVGVVNGNIVSDAKNFGIKLGTAKGKGHMLCQSNLIRDCRIGIAVSSSGDDIMASLNMIAGAKEGAIRAFDGDKLVGPDLARQSAEAYLNLMVAGNVVR
jgi:hypothetical protein